MKIIRKKKELKKLIDNEISLGFVPTMGAIHKGHISLVKKSNSQCNKTIVSIFVNKPQFNRKIDFKSYPRLLAKDIKILKNHKVDFLYLPKENEIYPDRPNKKIKIHPFKKKLCGKFRSGHFEAVVDVIDRFIKIIMPKNVYLGEKDMQQLKLIDHYITRKYKNINVVPCKTIREKNGVACSSRNYLLSFKEKSIASKIYQLLKRTKNNLIKRKINLNLIKNKIKNIGVSKIDYIEILDINKIIKPYLKKSKYKIFIAYYLRKTRLIDNI